MNPVLTTDAVSESEQLDCWRTAMTRALAPVAVTRGGDGPFTGRITTAQVGFLRVCAVEADAHRVSRTASHIARSADQFVVIGAQVSGRTVLTQDGRRADVGPGDLFAYDTARPYFLDHPERFATRRVHVPRRALGVPDEDLRRVTGTAIGTGHGCGAVLKPVLTTLVDSADAYSPAVAGRLASSLVDLFAVLVVENARNARAEADSSRSHLVVRIRDHIDRHLADPAMSPEDIAKAHHISVRYLHRLFEDEGITVGRLVQRRRLEECARELARGGRGIPSVSSVAQRWGFVNPARIRAVPLIPRPDATCCSS
ncbi:helix-turn-helix domain-containing protein, partial [Streptomyces sp. NPDC050264]|uniref:AraC-like ligand-binding domain-containing protein n=1 Tax=Streptomyces sp. NPDC050264 TaxID=3155038 RepID=UPI003425D691